MAKQTQKFIMSTFMQLLESESLDKITVRDIVEECEINRNRTHHASDFHAQPGGAFYLWGVLCINIQNKY